MISYSKAQNTHYVVTTGRKLYKGNRKWGTWLVIVQGKKFEVAPTVANKLPTCSTSYFLGATCGTTSGLPGSRALQWSLHSSHSMAAMCPGRAGHSGRGFTAERHTVYNLKNRRVTALFNGFFSDQFKYQVLVLILLSSIWHMFNSVSLKQFALGF